MITHVARAADSYRRLLTGAIEGVETPQYPSMQFRAEQIEEGAQRPVAELIADVIDSSARFEEMMRTLPEVAWRASVRMRVTGTQADLLAWLCGRTSGTGLSADGAETVPPAPYWI